MADGAPAGELRPTEGTWGAVEVAARYELFELDTEEVFARAAGQTDEIRQLWLGASWYWNPNVVFRLNYVHTDFADPVRIGGASEDAEDAILTRLQLSF